MSFKSFIHVLLATCLSTLLMGQAEYEEQFQKIIEDIQANKLEKSLSNSLKIADRSSGNEKALGHLYAAISYRTMLDIDGYEHAHPDENLQIEALGHYLQFEKNASADLIKKYNFPFTSGLRDITNSMVNFIHAQDYKSASKMLKAFVNNDNLNPTYILADAAIQSMQNADASVQIQQFMAWNAEGANNYQLDDIDLKALTEIAHTYAYFLNKVGQAEIAKQICTKVVELGGNQAKLNSYL